MRCDACGQEAPAGAAFCPHCGETLEGDSPSQGLAAAARLAPGGARGSANQPAEEELWTGSYSPKAMAGQAIGLGLLTIVGLIIALAAAGAGLLVWGIAVVVAWGLLGIVVLYRRLTVRYRLTTYRLFHETGLLSRTRNRIEVIDITDVTLTQGPIERMFNVGTIVIISSDVTNEILKMPGIEEVRRVTDLIDNTRRAERQRRGVFMENIGMQQPGPLRGS